MTRRAHSRSLSRAFLACALVCLAYPAAAQSPDALRFAGTYSTGCRVYYGWGGTTCAPSNDLDAPVLLADATTIIRMLGTSNIRQGPSFSSGIVGQVPGNACVRADSCGRYGDTDWCRIQYNGRAGWMAKQQSASSGRRYTLFSNRCGA